MTDQYKLVFFMIYRSAPFSVTVNDHKPRLQGHANTWRWIWH